MGPYLVIEWIPPDRLENITFMTNGGCATISKAEWKEGPYIKWNSIMNTLEKCGKQTVTLKELLKSNENSDNRWFHAIVSHFRIYKIASNLVQCYGLTKIHSQKNHMLVLRLMDL